MNIGRRNVLRKPKAESRMVGYKSEQRNIQLLIHLYNTYLLMQ